MHSISNLSTSEEKHAFWVDFGQYVGDSITYKLLNSSSNKILYRSAVCPGYDIHPNKHSLRFMGASGM